MLHVREEAFKLLNVCTCRLAPNRPHEFQGRLFKRAKRAARV